MPALGWIVYAQDGDIFIIDVSAPDNPIQLTDGPANDQQPVFSPDGRSIAFVSDRDGDNEIYVMQLDGAGVRALTDNTAADDAPAWSPDSSRIAFSSTVNGNRDIFLVDVSTVTLQQITTDPAADSAPQFGIDGTSIIFMSDRTGDWNIFFINTVGGSQGQIVSLPGNQQFPSLSKDGTVLLYSSNRTQLESYEIFRVPLNGNSIAGAPTQVTTDLNEDLFNTLPSISPDGTRMVFVQVNLQTNVPTIIVRDLASGDSTPLLTGTDPHYYTLTE